MLPTPADAAFVGAEYEENLATRTLTTVARRAGMEAGFVGFGAEHEADAVTRAIVRSRPAIVGLSMAFQHRAPQFLGLARRLRSAGWSGHLVAGGHFASSTAEPILRHTPEVDTVISGDGEVPLAMLLERLDEPARWGEVPGLWYRGGDGSIASTPPAAVVGDLDRLPLPARDTPLATHVGWPIASLCGSRGCYGNCTFCAINSFHRGRPGPRFRLRSPAGVAREMATLYHEKGARIFCFHDDTWFLPSTRRMRERTDGLADHLARLGVRPPYAVVAKARPDGIDAALLSHLRRTLGLMRLYVGVENFSRAGIAHLGRRTDPETIERGLAACGESGVYGCYNLLLFEPDATLEDIEENIAGMRRWVRIPVNFCRAEAYNGTALHRTLEERGRLRGNWMASDYEIDDPRVEMLFRIVYQAFKDRNFAPDALANLNMSLGYEVQVLEHFCEGSPPPEVEDLGREARALMEEINESSVSLLAEAVEFVGTDRYGDPGSTMSFTVDLASRVNFDGAPLHTRVLALRRAIREAAPRVRPGEVETSGEPAAMDRT